MRYRILEKDGKYYPQWKKWFWWNCWKYEGVKVFCLTLEEAEKFVYSNVDYSQYRVLQVGDAYCPQEKSFLWGWDNIMYGRWSYCNSLEEANKQISERFKPIIHREYKYERD